MENRDFLRILLPLICVISVLSINGALIRSVTSADRVDAIGRKVTALSGRITRLENTLDFCGLRDVLK